MGILDTFSLNNKVAIITGGAGLYGRQIAEALGEAGATTIMASRNVEKLEEVAKDFRNRGLKVYAYQVDQGVESSIKDLRSQVLDKYGKVDVLVNNAVLRTMKPDTYDPAAFAKSMEVNATGLYMISELFSEPMKTQKSGSIINIGSIQGMIGLDETLYESPKLSSKVADYFFHKGGMINYTRFFAACMGPYNVRVNCISPGGFFSNQSEYFVKRYCDRTFLGRMAGESDLKGVIVFLASEASVYLTGTNIPVDGGYTAK
jgi:NAD(P)-dependent dehydrogenase (short-subunit alcohol dehydrogenase family)